MIDERQVAKGVVPDPWARGTRNGFMACIPVFLAQGYLLIHVGRLLPQWALAVSCGVIVFIFSVCLAHAHLGARLGRQRADRIILVVMLVVLVMGVSALVVVVRLLLE